MTTVEKGEQLEEWLKTFEKVAIAYSGGVDSTFLLAVAKTVHTSNVLALTVKTPYIPDRELKESVDFCRKNHIEHRIVHADIADSMVMNPENRCYLCKHALFSLMQTEALRAGFPYVFDGSNADDSTVYRPGLKALKELGIRSPLMENGISKAEVRDLSARMQLSTSSKPSYACLLTRFPYHYSINRVELKRVELAEEYLAAVGFANARVRNHGNMARIEIEKHAIMRFMQSEVKDSVTHRLHEIGYDFVTVDLEGYRSGSFDKTIK